MQKRTPITYRTTAYRVIAGEDATGRAWVSDTYAAHALDTFAPRMNGKRRETFERFTTTASSNPEGFGARYDIGLRVCDDAISTAQPFRVEQIAPAETLPAFVVEQTTDTVDGSEVARYTLRAQDPDAPGALAFVACDYARPLLDAGYTPHISTEQAEGTRAKPITWTDAAGRLVALVMPCRRGYVASGNMDEICGSEDERRRAQVEAEKRHAARQSLSQARARIVADLSAPAPCYEQTALAL